MLSAIRKSYTHTIYASYLGYITQAIVNNFAPLLFITFIGEFDLKMEMITLITTVNFAVQLAVDAIAAKVVDRIGYRPCIVAAHVFAAAGLAGLAVFPAILPPFAGIMTAVVLYAVGGGILEVLVSPIVEACPSERKAAAMSLLHSFYCWGHVFLVVVSTAFFAVCGIANWRVLACLWALIPLLNVFYFLLVPLAPVVQEGTKQLTLRELFRSKVFWVLMVMMVCAGASEQAMSQWASAFAEKGLGVSKTLGDLAGPCAFAILMGAARALYGKFEAKIPLRTFMAASCGLCIGCYLLAALSGNALLALVGCAMCGFSVGIFWPGTFSTGAAALPGGGTAMFALMALGGDVGCSAGPTVVGLVSGALGGSLQSGLLVALAFPMVMLAFTLLMRPEKASLQGPA
ncbi:MAG: MFS transporter [Clostridia bacterium]|nr:MFS transporter [Clostridia bacterium]